MTAACVGLAKAPNGSEPRARLFLSYGRKDAGDLARRLKADMEEQGFWVWLDTHEIRTGRAWEIEIRDGLRSTQVVVAMLSPHAVRIAAPEAPDVVDGVCLDEISFARFARPPIPIVPVMAVACEPPFCIFRLDYTDLTRWSESEDQYRIGFQRLLGGIEAALRDETIYRRWHHQLQPLEFELLLNEKRQDFTGRHWLFEQIDAWRNSPRERALLITGSPGSGKSALVAQLVHRNPGGQVLAYHCCQVSRRETLLPGRFVQSVAAMIASQLDAYAEQLETPALQDRLADTFCQNNSVTAFYDAILTPLSRLAAPPGGCRYLLIDALDEALLLSRDNLDHLNLVSLLAPELEKLPGWLRVVATTRPEKKVLRALGGLRAVVLDSQGPGNRQDIDAYIALRLQAPALVERLTASGRNESEVRRQLCEAGGSNFLYVQQALLNLERDRYRFDQLDRLPQGLDGIYADFFQRCFPGRASYHDARTVLEAVVAAREPLTTAQLAQAAGLDPEYRLPEVLETLASFLCESEGRYTLFHQSLGDWLVAADCPYRASPAIGQRRLAELCWGEYRQGVHRLSDYSRRHVVAHLRADQRWDDLAIVLTDLAYLETRSEADDRVFGLVRDLADAVDAWPTEHPQRSLVQLLQEVLRQDANFIARHPGALFQCLWNNGWWHNNPAAEAHYLDHSPTSQGNAARLCELLEQWRCEKARRTPAFRWLRRLRPPPVPVGTTQRAVLAGHVGAVRSVATSPDGQRIASSSDDASVRLWDLGSGEELLCLRGHTGPVLCVNFSADGQAVVSAGTDGTVRLWDVETGAQRHCLEEHTGWVVSVAASLDGRWIVSGSDDATVRVWNTDTGQQRLCLRHPSRVTAVACSPDSRVVASGAEDHTVRLWDLETGSECCRLSGHNGPILSLSFASSASMLASGASDGTLRVWNMPGGDLRLNMQHGGPVSGVVFEPDARTLLSAGEHDKVCRWDVHTGQRRGGFLSLRGKTRLRTLALSPDGRWLLSGYDDGFVRMWDVEQVVRGNIHEDIPLAVATREVRLSAEATATGESRALVRELRGHTQQVRTLVYSPDGYWLATGGDDSNVWIWDADTGAPLRCLTGHQETIRSLAFSPDSRWIASGSEDATVRVWNVSSGQQRLTLTGHAAKVVSVAFSPDAQLIISQGYREQRVWDAESGACVQVGARSSAGTGTTAPGTIQRTTQAKDPHDSFIGYTSSVWEEGRWRVTIKGQDMVLEAVGEDGPVAWFPGRTERMAAHPQRDDWAGSVGWFVTIVRLEHN